MVATRRTSRSGDSLAGSGADDASARGAARGAPPPPPPPPPPAAGLGAPAPAVGEEAAARGGMAAIPEEVAVRDAEREPLLGRQQHDAVEPQHNPAARAPPPVQVQYLNVRVPPSEAALRPSRVHRRHHRRPPPMPGQRPMNNGRSSRKQVPPSHHDGEIVRVLIPANGFASEQQLSECLSQAGAADFAGDRGSRWESDFDDDYSMDEYFDERGESHVAGMFRESDRVFVPLSVIYANPNSFVGDVLCVKRPPPKPKRPSLRPTQMPARPRSIFITFLELMGVVLVLLISQWAYMVVDWEYAVEDAFIRVESFIFGFINFPFWLFDTLIDFPLRELYRHGPSVIGWEGEPLPRICARVTYHGDETFWSRNIEECERIYLSKEAAAMQVRKPIVVGLLIVVAFFMVKSVVEARARAQRQRIDPNMVETYRAIQMLTRQLRRAATAR
ncbi:hypothetical protein ACHAXT_008117 [Thalassiosira profunda]